MNNMNRLRLTVTIFLIFPLLVSCFGLSMDIQFNQNGSGTLSLEYRVSKSLDSIGKLDGNERWNTIPVGRSGFERTLARLPEMKLLSFSSKEDSKNVIVNAKMSFSSIQGLIAFLDAGGQRSSFSGNAVGGNLLLGLSDGAGIKNSELAKLIEEVSDSYSISIKGSFPSEGSLAVLDNKGTPIETPRKGKTVSCSFPLYDVLSSTSGINVELKW